MSPVAAPADRRFRRSHVKPMRRQKWQLVGVRAAKYIVLALVVLFVLYRSGSAVAHARALQIDHIVVKGNGRLTDDDVLAVLDGLRGQNLVWTNLDAWRNRLLASPWVRDASLKRSLPSTVEVQLSERAPIALGRLGRTLYLVDERGQAIDEYGPQYKDLDLPIVDGLAMPKTGGTWVADEPRADLVARLLSALSAKPKLAKRISQIDVSDLHNAAVIMSGDQAVLYLGDDRFLPRLESYVDLNEELHKRVPDIDYIDLRFDDRIYVRPVAASHAVSVGKPNKG